MDPINRNKKRTGHRYNPAFSQEKYRLIFDRAPIGVVHIDSQGLVTDCNDYFVRVSGSSRETLIVLNTLKLPHERIEDAISGP